MKRYLQFTLSVLCLAAILAVGWYLDVDVSGNIVAVLAIYIGGRSINFGAAAISSSRDETADTRAIINDMKEH